MSRPRWLVAVSDLHVGSPVALCPPKFELDDGGLYQPNTLQNWLWEGWLKCWNDAKALVGKDPWDLLLDGDLIEGDHHRNKQVITTVIGCQIRAAMDCLDVPLALGPTNIHVVRGTESHVGVDVEEGISRQIRRNIKANPRMRVVMDPDTGQASSYWRRFMVNGRLVEARHHVTAGQRAWTRRSLISFRAFEVWSEHTLSGDTPPELSIRGHVHRYLDSGYDHRGVTRVVTLPCWQMPTGFVHRIACEGLPDIGLVAFRFTDQGIDAYPFLHNASRPTVVEAA